jgi:general secretion pathway protein G
MSELMGVEPLHNAADGPRRHRGRGFTLVEMAMTAAVLGLIAAVAVPSYSRVLERQKINQCAMDLRDLALRIDHYRAQHGSVPGSLADLGPPLPRDPWGWEYRFLNFSSATPGQIRKDYNLHPLNTEFDLYSVGRDGRSFPPLTASSSRDDVIWARDGAFVGLAADY